MLKQFVIFGLLSTALPSGQRGIEVPSALLIVAKQRPLDL